MTIQEQITDAIEDIFAHIDLIVDIEIQSSQILQQITSKEPPIGVAHLIIFGKEYTLSLTPTDL